MWPGRDGGRLQSVCRRIPAIPTAGCLVATQQAAAVPVPACLARTIGLHAVDIVARADINGKSHKLRRQVQRQVLLEVRQWVFPQAVTFSATPSGSTKRGSWSQWAMVVCFPLYWKPSIISENLIRHQ